MAASSDSNPQSPPHSRNVLVVDDNAVNRELVTEMLTRSGVSCQAAENGQEAIEQLEKSPYSLVLMDLEMPVMNGIDAARAIRASGKPYKDIPIIALTGHTEAENKLESLDAGMNGYLSKPISLGDLLKSLGEYNR